MPYHILKPNDNFCFLPPPFGSKETWLILSERGGMGWGQPPTSYNLICPKIRRFPHTTWFNPFNRTFGDRCVFFCLSLLPAKNIFVYLEKTIISLAELAKFISIPFLWATSIFDVPHFFVTHPSLRIAMTLYDPCLNYLLM